MWRPSLRTAYQPRSSPGRRRRARRPDRGGQPGSRPGDTSLGSTSEAVLAPATVPVLIVRAGLPNTCRSPTITKAEPAAAVRPRSRVEPTCGSREERRETALRSLRCGMPVRTAARHSVRCARDSPSFSSTTTRSVRRERGLRDLLESEIDITVVGEASTEHDAVLQVTVLDPDVAILDVRLAEGNGVAACRQIRSRHPRTACLMLTSFSDDDALFEAIMAGAAGYVLKQIRSNDLVGRGPARRCRSESARSGGDRASGRAIAARARRGRSDRSAHAAGTRSPLAARRGPHQPPDR